MGMMACNGEVYDNLGTLTKANKTISYRGETKPIQEYFFDRFREKTKYYRFVNVGYTPNIYQNLIHSSTARIIIGDAGRRGGKSHAAAFECADLSDPLTARDTLRKRGVKFTITDVQNEEDTVISGAVITRESTSGAVSRTMYLNALDLLIGVDGYDYNQTQQVIWIPNKQQPKVIVKFFTTTDANRIRGNGFHWIWGDEFAFVRGSYAWRECIRPALSDYRGCAIFTTTPATDVNDWWFYDEFIDRTGIGGVEDDFGNTKSLNKNIEYLQWYSVEGFFPEDEWRELKEEVAAGLIPAVVFQREYMARWVKGSGGLLKEEHLIAFDNSELTLTVTKEYYMNNWMNLQLHNILDFNFYDMYMGVDPAVSVKESADYTAVRVVAVDKRSGIGYFVDGFKEHLHPAEQPEKIRAMAEKWQVKMIGVESNGYQVMLAEYTQKLSNKFVVHEIKNTEKKENRLYGMSAVFATGALRVRYDDTDFRNEWLTFPVGAHDDVLDASDMALNIIPNFYATMSVSKPTNSKWTGSERFQEMVGKKIKQCLDNNKEPIGGMW